MAFGTPSGTNTFIPNSAASQSLIVGYSRNPGTFRISQYAQYIKAKQRLGLYYVWRSKQGARILTTNDAEHIWVDGDAAPTGVNNLEGWETKQFMTTRRCYAYLMGKQAVDQADFGLLASQAGVSAMQAMTARTMLVQTALTNAVWGDNTAKVNDGILASGQTWATGNDGSGSNQGPNIKRSLQYGAKIVHQKTLGSVQPNQLSLVVNPNTAQLMAASTEIQDYIKQSPFAMAQLRQDVPAQNGQWGLPNTLYGHNVVVEDAVRVSTNKNAATDTISYILPDGVAYLIAREGELEGFAESRSFSTIQIFFYQDELTVRTMYDSINERYLGQVISDYAPLVVSTASGFRFTDVGLPPDPEA